MMSHMYEHRLAGLWGGVGSDENALGSREGKSPSPPGHQITGIGSHQCAEVTWHMNFEAWPWNAFRDGWLVDVADEHSGCPAPPVYRINPLGGDQ
jgi:hypothetical protein